MSTLPAPAFWGLWCHSHPSQGWLRARPASLHVSSFTSMVLCLGAGPGSGSNLAVDMMGRHVPRAAWDSRRSGQQTAGCGPRRFKVTGYLLPPSIWLHSCGGTSDPLFPLVLTVMLSRCFRGHWHSTHSAGLPRVNWQGSLFLSPSTAHPRPSGPHSLPHSCTTQFCWPLLQPHGTNSQTSGEGEDWVMLLEDIGKATSPTSSGWNFSSRI